MVYPEKMSNFNLPDERKTDHKNGIINLASPHAKQATSTSIPGTSDLIASVDPAAGGYTTPDPDNGAPR